MVKFTALDVTLTFPKGARLSPWLGNKFRGGFGHHLRPFSCKFPLEGATSSPSSDEQDSSRWQLDDSSSTTTCPECQDQFDECLFYKLYQATTARRGHSPPPRPIVFIPPFTGQPHLIPPRRTLRLRVLIFGSFTRYLFHLIHGLNLLGSRGFRGSPVASSRDADPSEPSRQRQGTSKVKYTRNTFFISRIVNAFTNQVVFDGHNFFYQYLTTMESTELPPLVLRHPRLAVSFTTPLVLKTPQFPVPFSQFLHLAWLRHVRLENEYGKQQRLPNPHELLQEWETRLPSGVRSRDKDAVVPARAPYEPITCNLHWKSTRQGKRFFKGMLGYQEFVFPDVDLPEELRQLLAVARWFGLGQRMSFGCGFFKYVF